MIFYYQARDSQGQIQAGKIDAQSLDSAISTLQGHDLTVLNLEPESQRSFWEDLFGKRNRINGQELSLFMRQFSTLLQAHVPLSESLKSLIAQTSSPAMKDTIYQLNIDIDSGLTLSQAMARNEGVFSEFYIQMVRSAELSGRLEETLGYLADYADHEYKLNARAKSALVYPLFVLGTFVVVGAFITISIAPQMSGIFGEFDAQPPLATRILMNAGHFLANWGIILLVILIGLAWVIKNYLSSAEGERFKGYWLLKVPILGNMYRQIFLARFAETCGTLVRGSIPIVTALEVAGDSTGNFLYKQVGHELAEKVKQGKSISQAIADYPIEFPVMVSQMVAVGERTGRVDDLLLRASKYYQDETERSFASLLDIFQPVLIIILGIFVGLLVWAILMPIYQLANTV
ncbi:MAG TPA: type II secretion system F family protein [Candidatus Paceibacterota bacterium]|nr:type II secretion system F family protein [Candidatus Paceibacterota bacterium]